VARLLAHDGRDEVGIELHALRSRQHVVAPAPGVVDLPESTRQRRITGRRRRLEVPPHDPERHVIALGLDPRAREPVEANRISPRALNAVLELLGSILREIDTLERLEPREPGIGPNRLARLGWQRNG